MLDAFNWIWIVAIGLGTLALLVALGVGTRWTRRHRTGGPPPGREVPSHRGRG